MINIPSSAQDGLVWRGRRGGVHRCIVVIVDLAVFGVAVGVVQVVVHDGDIGGCGGEMEGHERRQVSVRWRVISSSTTTTPARHRPRYLTYRSESFPNKETSAPNLCHVDTRTHHPSPPTCSTTTTTMSNTILLCVSLFSSRKKASSRNV